MDSTTINLGQNDNVSVVARDPKDPEHLKRCHSSDSEVDAETNKLRRVEESIVLPPPPTFLTVKHKDENQSLAKVSPFVINKAFAGAGGQPKSIKKLRNGTLLVEAINGNQATKYLKMTSLFEQVQIVVEPHVSLNYSKGVVFSRELMECPIAEIKVELREDLVVDVVRIVRKENGVDVPTAGHILTFATPQPPETIHAGYLSLSVRPYFKNPQRCFKCQRFGHSSKVCPKDVTCCRCGQSGHDESVCSNSERCVNCKGEHSASSRSCKVYLEEKEVLKISTIERISFSEAKREYRSRQSTLPKPNFSYSDAVASPAPAKQCSSCEKLEGMVLALTEQVAMLVAQLSKVSLPPLSATQVQHQPPAKEAPSAAAKTKSANISTKKPQATLSSAKATVKAPIKSKGHTNTSSPCHSSHSSIVEDMDEDDPESEALNKFKKVIRPQQGKAKTKITFKTQ